MSCFGMGFLEDAKNYFLKGAELCEKTNHHFWNSMDNHFLGEFYFEIGEYQTAKGHYEKSAWFMEQIGWLPSWVNLNKIAVSRAKVMSNDKDINLDSLYGYVFENRIKQHEGWMRRCIAEIVMNIKDKNITEAEDWLKQAIEADSQNGMRFHLGRDYNLYVELLKRRGDQLKAKENLHKAIEIYKECGADGWVEKAEKELAGLS